MAQHKGRSSSHKFVILNIKEGQHFGYLKKKLVRIVVLFENQLLTSNQTYITPAPFFGCHFSWLVENNLLNRLQSTRTDILIEFKISEEGKKEERTMGCVTIALRQAEYITAYSDSPRCRSLELKGPKLPFGVRNPQIFISLIIQKFKPLNTVGEWHFAELDAQDKVSEASESTCDSLPNQEDCSTKSQINIKKDCVKNIHNERNKSLMQDRRSVDKAASSDDTIATSRVFSDADSPASEILHESIAKAAYSKRTAVSDSIISLHQTTTNGNLEAKVSSSHTTISTPLSFGEVNTGSFKSPQKPIPKEPSTSSSIPEELSFTGTNTQSLEPPQKPKEPSTCSSIPEELSCTGTNTESLELPQNPILPLQKSKPKEPSTCSSIPEELSCTGTNTESLELPQNPKQPLQKSKPKEPSTCSSIPEELSCTGTNTESSRKPKELSTCSSISYASSYAGTCGRSETQSENSALKDSSTSHAVSKHIKRSDKYLQSRLSGIPLQSISKAVCSKRTPTLTDVGVISSRNSQAAKIPYESTSRGASSEQTGASLDGTTSTHAGTSRKDSHQSTSKPAHSTQTVASTSETHRMISHKHMQDSNILHESISKVSCDKQAGTSPDDTAALHRMFPEESSQIPHKFNLKGAFSKHTSTHQLSSDKNLQVTKVPLESTSKSASSKHNPSHHTSSEKNSQASAALLESTSKSTLSKCVVSHQTVSDKETQISGVLHESISKAAFSKRAMVPCSGTTIRYPVTADNDWQAVGVASKSTSKGAYSKWTETSSVDTIPSHRTIPGRGSQASGLAHESFSKIAHSKQMGTSSDDTGALHRMISELYSPATEIPHLSISKTASSSDESTPPMTKSRPVQRTKVEVPFDVTTSRKLCDKNTDVSGISRIYSPVTVRSNKETPKTTYLDPSMWTKGPFPKALTGHTFMTSDVLTSNISESKDSSQSIQNISDDNIDLPFSSTEERLEESMLQEYSIDESSVHGLQDTSKISHMYKIELHVKSIEWLRAVKTVEVEIKFYNPHSNSKVTVKGLDYSIPNLLTDEIICSMYYMSLPEDLLKVIVYQPPQILFYKLDKKLIARGALKKKNLEDRTRLNMFDTFILIKEKTDEIIGEAHVVIKLEDLGIASKYIQSACLESTVKYEKSSLDTKTAQNISLQDIVGDFELLAAIHEKLRQSFQKMDAGFQKLLKAQMLENVVEHEQKSQNREARKSDEKTIATSEDKAKGWKMHTLQNVEATTSACNTKIQKPLLVHTEPAAESKAGETEVWCEFCRQFHNVKQMSSYITAIEASGRQQSKCNTFPKQTVEVKRAVHSQRTSDSKPQVQDSKEIKPSKARSLKQAGVQTTKPLKPREMSYIPKPAITVVKYPCQGCEQYLEVGYGQRVWQDDDLTFWCKDCCIRKLQSEVKETMQKCASEVSTLKNQLKTLEDEYGDFIVHSVSKEKYEYLSAAQHNLTMLFMHAKHQNEYLHAQYSLAAKKLEELKQTIPEQSPLFDITHIEDQFYKDKEQMMEACNRVESLKREIDDFQNKDRTPKQAKELPKGKIPTSAKSTEKSEPKLSSRKERCEACRIISNQAGLAEKKKSKPIQTRVPQQIRPVNADNLLKTDESKKKAPAAASTFCVHEISNRMASVRAKLQHYMEERDELVRVNHYTCDNIVVSYMTTAINKLLVEWTELKTELEKCSQ